jgi:formate-dependent nitrite reductase membrane component NrfD
MLILDLMYKTRFWFTMRVFNVSSPMSLGVWLLSLFAAISLVHALFWLPETLRARLSVVGGWSGWRKTGYRYGLGLVGMVVAIVVSVYTGVLLSVSALPLWRNMALPGLFCFSAMATGFAGAGVIALRAAPPEAMEQPILWLRSGYRIVLPVYLLFALLYLLCSFLYVSRDDLAHLVTGGNGVIWWAGALGLGILLPLVLVLGRGSMNRVRLSVTLSALLVGGFLLRLVLVAAGQART